MAKVKLNITLDPEIYERLKAYAARNYTTASAVITQWVLHGTPDFDDLEGQDSASE